MNKAKTARILALLNAPEMDEGVIAELGSLGKEAVKFLLATATGRESPVYLRHRATSALGRLAPPGAAEAIRRLLTDPDVRLHAIYALADIKGAGAVTDLLPMLSRKQTDYNTRAHVIEVIGELGDQKAVAELERWLGPQRDQQLLVVAQRALESMRRRGLLPRHGKQV